MSDRGGETPRPSSKRTQRYQPPQPESHRFLTRRNFVAGSLTTLGALALAALGFRAEPRSNPTYPPSTRNQPQLSPENSSPESKAIRAKLGTLSQEIIANPQSFKERAPEIGNMAIEFFCKELGYNPKDYEGKTHYLWGDEYQKKANSDSNCVSDYITYNTYGYVYASGDSLIINLDASLYEPGTAKSLQPYPTIALFMVMLHELHHLTSPLLDDPRSEVPGSKLRGLAFYIPDPERNKPGLVCSNAYRSHLEEAIVHDSVQRMASKLGIGLPPTEDYDIWAERYKTGVINRFFNGNNRALLMLHQKTRPDEFHRFIGEKMGVFSPQAQLEAGERYVFQLITQGKS